jgi:hypothetical protein
MQINNVTWLLRLETHLDLDQAGTIGFCIFIILYFDYLCGSKGRKERECVGAFMHAGQEKYKIVYVLFCDLPFSSTIFRI